MSSEVFYQDTITGERVDVESLQVGDSALLGRSDRPHVSMFFNRLTEFDIQKLREGLVEPEPQAVEPVKAISKLQITFHEMGFRAVTIFDDLTIEQALCRVEALQSDMETKKGNMWNVNECHRVNQQILNDCASGKKEAMIIASHRYHRKQFQVGRVSQC